MMGFRCAVFVCMHMCCNLFIFKLKQSLCPSSPLFPSNVYCFLAGSTERWVGVFLDGKFWGNVRELCVLCLNAHREMGWVTVSEAMQRCNFSS